MRVLTRVLIGIFLWTAQLICTTNIFVRIAAVSVILFGWVVGTCNATSFEVKTAEMLKTHSRVIAAKSSADSLREALLTLRKEWFPNLAIATTRGKEFRYNNEAANSGLISSDFNLTLNQPLFDFGSRSNKIKNALFRLNQAEKTIKLVKQSLLLEAISVQVNLLNSAKIVKYSNNSVLNIKRQAQLEDARVLKGAGLSTDVLQAKVQLAGAEGRYNLSVNTLKASRNRYKAVFGKTVGNEEALVDIVIPEDFVDYDIDNVVSKALSGNFQLQSLQIATDIAKNEIRLVKAEQLAPKIDFIAERKFKKNIGGVVGSSQESTIKLQFNYNLNLGLPSLNNINAAKFNYVSSDNQFRDARQLIEENARNAFEQYEAVTQNLLTLENQARISSEFLVLARKERKLGNRSLIDVLSGESAEINAKSDAASANAQLVISAYNILFVMGELTLDTVKFNVSRKAVELKSTFLLESNERHTTKIIVDSLKVAPSKFE